MEEDVTLRGPNTSEPDSESAFRAYLARLKRNGCGILLSGEAPERARIAASQQLFGSTDPDVPRRRLLINTDPGIDPDAYLPASVHPGDDTVRVVQIQGQVRGTTATAASPGPRLSVLDQLEADIDDAFADLVRTETPAPGELRVGITTVQPLIELAGLQRVEECCTLLVAKARTWDGMVHFHAPMPPTDERVSTLEQHVDARVDLRIGPEEDVEWLWHTGKPEIDSSLSWIAI
jgi:hypothetical protein